MAEHPHDRTRLVSAIEAAARELPAGSPTAHVFYEAREDRRWRVAADGSREFSVARARGAAIVAGVSLHVTDPRPEDLAALARGAAAGSPPRPLPREGGEEGETADPREVGDLLARQLRNRLAGAGAWSSGAVEIRLIEFVQNIWVCRRDGEPRADVRRSRRAEVHASRLGPARSGRAVEERTLGAGELPPDDLVDRAISRASALASARARIVEPPWGALVLAPAVAGLVAHELIGHALEGDVVVEGRSRLAAAAELAIPPALRIVDDPSRGRAAWAIDDEGTPSRAVTLIEGGRVAGALHDLTTGLAHAVPSTGHGRRGSYLDRVLPRMGCTYIDTGTDDPRAIVAGTTRGIYVRRIAAGETQPRAGRASFVVTDADVIEGGALGEPLRPFAIVLDVASALGAIDAIGNDLEFDRCIGSCIRDGQAVATSVGAPTIRLGVVRASAGIKN